MMRKYQIHTHYLSPTSICPAEFSSLKAQILHNHQCRASLVSR